MPGLKGLLAHGGPCRLLTGRIGLQPTRPHEGHTRLRAVSSAGTHEQIRLRGRDLPQTEYDPSRIGPGVTVGMWLVLDSAEARETRIDSLRHVWLSLPILE